MDQPIPNVTDADVTRVIERDFPAADRNRLRNVLDQYTKSNGPVPLARVHLAILKLSGGEPGKVIEFTQSALVDYRDVLAWAEYPRYFNRGDFPTDAEEQQTIDEDWAEYKGWLDRK